MSPLHVVQPWEKLRTVNQDGVFSPHKIWSQIHKTTYALDSAKHAKLINCINIYRLQIKGKENVDSETWRKTN